MKYLYQQICKTALLILTIVLITSPHQIFAQDKPQKIDQLLLKYYEYGQLNGSALVAENGKVIYKKGFGLANMEWDIPNATDTKFRLASISKQFTAMLILQLVEEGKIKLESKLSDYLPYYRKDTGEKVTIHHLLTHTSGIPSYTNVPGYWQKNIRDPYTVDELIKQHCSGDFEFEPDAQFKYNNSGYVILGAIIEHVTGKLYEEVLKEKIFNPLGMKNSGYDHNSAVLAKRAAGYGKNLTGYRNAAYIDMSQPHAAGALYSTVEDMYLWDQALYTNQLLSKKYRDIMFTPYKNNYGYGWGINKVSSAPGKDSLLVIDHNGGINGFNTRIMRLVDDKHLIVILCNAPGANINQITGNIKSILYDQSYEIPKKSAADVLAKTIMKSGIEAALEQYRDLKADNSNTYSFRENEFNRLGYALLNNKGKEAVEIFKLNVEAYPESVNTYDSLAEAYMKTGNKELAIKYYKIVLEKLPDNKNINPDFKTRLKKGAEENLKKLQDI
jgi:CubicO group peptidase (beta-lactamase class C family)